ncbi:hypothetical protein ACHAXA_010638 [Cyclostephanos tholiformis]|uniref:SAM domain-containing protein n=2 Tax=Cyclostephanos tholiformis TaxID=382380 RepID=A0ABD3R4F5_9STRA
MKLKDVNDPLAIFYHQNYGPGFGGRGHDIRVTGSTVTLNPGCSYHPGPLTEGSYTIEEMEVFQVSGLPPVARISASTGMQAHATALKFERETRFSADVNKAIDAKQACLLQAEAEMFRSEESFDEEQTFIEKFALGDAKDVISLNVSGTMMVTTRATLCAMKDSVLAQQFDDSKWTEQGCDGPLVDEWTPDQVSTWAKSIKGLPEDVGIVLYENEITGRELLAMNIDSLKMMGLKRAGTVALLLKEIKKFDRTSQDVVTLIEHSSYCFGKILDYLCLKQLHLSGLIINEPKLPEVCDTQKRRFEKVVTYYFPGIAVRSTLG